MHRPTPELVSPLLHGLPAKGQNMGGVWGTLVPPDTGERPRAQMRKLATASMKGVLDPFSWKQMV